jgi:hypothetical protein
MSYPPWKFVKFRIQILYQFLSTRNIKVLALSHSLYLHSSINAQNLWWGRDSHESDEPRHQQHSWELGKFNLAKNWDRHQCCWGQLVSLSFLICDLLFIVLRSHAPLFFRSSLFTYIARISQVARHQISNPKYRVHVVCCTRLHTLQTHGLALYLSTMQIDHRKLCQKVQSYPDLAQMEDFSSWGLGSAAHCYSSFTWTPFSKKKIWAAIEWKIVTKNESRRNRDWKIYKIGLCPSLTWSPFIFQAPVHHINKHIDSLTQSHHSFSSFFVGFLHSNNIITSKMAFTLPEQMVRTVGIFQGLLALPVLLFTAAVALQALAYAYDYVYEFTWVFPPNIVCFLIDGV